MQALLLGNKIDYVFTVKNVSSNIIYIQKVLLLHPLSYFLFEDLGGILEENKIPTLDPGKRSFAFFVKFKYKNLSDEKDFNSFKSNQLLLILL